MPRFPLFLAVFSGALALAAPPPKGPPPRPLVPAFGLALDGRPIDAARLGALAAAHGRRPGCVVVFEQWPEFPPAAAATAAPALAGLAASLDAIETAGAQPVVTWEPMYYRQVDGREVILPATTVLSGRYDAYIDALAALLAGRRRPVIVRLMHEPNLARYHWGVAKEAYQTDAPTVYQNMWRHIVRRARGTAGPRAHHLLFAFCANAESVPGPGNAADAAWNTITAYYPGAEWVDVVGVDGYNWGDTQTPARHGWQSTWRSFADVLGPAVAELRRLAPGRPLYVFETATAATGGDKSAWLRATAATARTWQLAALCWFEANKEVDWRLNTGVPPGAVPAFIDALAAESPRQR